MRLLLLFLLINFKAFGQMKNAFPPGNYDHQCVYKKKYSDTTRLHFYPFNKAAEIKLVSFRYQKYDTTPVSKSSVIVDSLQESMSLSKNSIDSLTDILYNNFYKKRGNVGEIPQCWMPRNAILFYNASGKLFETMIICFHCEEYRASSDKVKLGDDCYEKVEKLRAYFISQGVKFGTDPEIPGYPGEQ